MALKILHGHKIAQPLVFLGVLLGFVLHSANHTCFPAYGYVCLSFFFF